MDTLGSPLSITVRRILSLVVEEGFGSFPSERAVPRGCRVNPAGLVGWNELDSHGACRDRAFVADEVHVLATRINKPHPLCVHVGLTFWIMAFVFSHRSGGDDDQAVARVR